MQQSVCLHLVQERINYGYVKNFSEALIETGTGLQPAVLQVEASPQYTNTLTLPTFSEAPSATDDEMQFVFTSPVVKAGVTPDADADKARELIAGLEQQVRQSNIDNKFVPAEETVQTGTASAKAPASESAFTAWVRDVFGEERVQTVDAVENIAIVGVRLNKQPAADEISSLPSRGSAYCIQAPASTSLFPSAQGAWGHGSAG